MSNVNDNFYIADARLSANVIFGSDPRLTDARTPNGPAGGDLDGNYPNPTLDVITTAQTLIGGNTTVPVISIDDKGRVTALTTATISQTTDASLLTTGTLSDARLSANVVFTTDTRLSNSRTPTAHKSSHSIGGTDVLSPSDIGAALSSTVQVFSSSGTWTKPTGAKSVHVLAIGGGGGGGGGGMQASGNNVRAGGGGQGGGLSERTIPATQLGISETVTVGAAGTGGAAATVNGFGSDGVSGGMSSFGIWVIAEGGVYGQGTNPGGTSNQKAMYAGGSGAAGGTNAAGSSSNATAMTPTGGGGGGGCGPGPTAYNGGFGQSPLGNFAAGNQAFPGTANGAGTAKNGQDGKIVTGSSVHPGGGGAGGGGGTTTGGGNGGAGGTCGGGGGGGGGALSGFTPGTGGNGGSGIVVVTTYF